MEQPLLHKVLVHGHRGARALLPENTLPGFEYAIAQGVDALELDLAVTRDDVVVVSHDPVLRPPVCSGPRPGAAIRTLTLEQVKQWDCGKARNPAFPRQQAIPATRMPALDEVLDLAPRGTFLFDLEIKSFPDHPELAPPPQEFARMVLERVRAHHLESRVIVQSFDYRALMAMQQLAPEIARAALVEGSARDFAAIAGDAVADIISPQFGLVTAEQVRAAHAAGLRVVAWTANAPRDWDRLIACGVDGIITDDPAALLAHLGRK